MEEENTLNEDVEEIEENTNEEKKDLSSEKILSWIRRGE